MKIQYTITKKETVLEYSNFFKLKKIKYMTLRFIDKFDDYSSQIELLLLKDSLKITENDTTIELPFHNITNLIVKDKYIFIGTDFLYKIFVPINAFENNESKNLFINTIKSNINSNKRKKFTYYNENIIMDSKYSYILLVILIPLLYSIYINFNLFKQEPFNEFLSSVLLTSSLMSLIIYFVFIKLQKRYIKLRNPDNSFLLDIENNNIIISSNKFKIITSLTHVNVIQILKKNIYFYNKKNILLKNFFIPKIYFNNKLELSTFINSIKHKKNSIKIKKHIIFYSTSLFAVFFSLGILLLIAPYLSDIISSIILLFILLIFKIFMYFVMFLKSIFDLLF